MFLHLKKVGFHDKPSEQILTTAQPVQGSMDVPDNAWNLVQLTLLSLIAPTVCLRDGEVNCRKGTLGGKNL